MEKSSFKQKETKSIPSFVAKGYCEIHQNEVHLTFKKGKEYSSVDKKWLPTLKQQNIL